MKICTRNENNHKKGTLKKDLTATFVIRPRVLQSKAERKRRPEAAWTGVLMEKFRRLVGELFSAKYRFNGLVQRIFSCNESNILILTNYVGIWIDFLCHNIHELILFNTLQFCFDHPISM